MTGPVNIESVLPASVSNPDHLHRDHRAVSDRHHQHAAAVAVWRDALVEDVGGHGKNTVSKQKREDSS